MIVWDQGAHQPSPHARRAPGEPELGRGSLRRARGPDRSTSFVPPALWLRTDRTRGVADIVMKATKAEPHTDHPALQVAAGTTDVAFFAMAGPWDIATPKERS